MTHKRKTHIKRATYLTLVRIKELEDHFRKEWKVTKMNSI